MMKKKQGAKKSAEPAATDTEQILEKQEPKKTLSPNGEIPGSSSSEGEPVPVEEKPPVQTGPPRDPVTKKFISRAEAEKRGIEFVLEEPKPKPKKRGGFSLKEMLEGDPEAGAEKKSKRKKGVKSVTKVTADDLAELILVPGLILLATFAIDDEELQPIESEIQAFVNPMARMMERHLPLEGELPADVLDVGLMALALFAYFSRVVPVIVTRRREATQTGTEDYDGSRTTTRDRSRDDGKETPATHGRQATDQSSGLFVGGVI